MQHPPVMTQHGGHVDASEVDALRAAALAAFTAAADGSALEQARVDHLGRRSPLATAQKQLGGMTDEERRRVGALLNELKSVIGEAFDARHAELENVELAARLAAERIDLTGPARRVRPGRPHLLTQVEAEIVDVFVGMGFSVAEGPEVESGRFNFDLLNIPPDHPARGTMDTIYVDEAADIVLRTHTSPVQVRTMLAQRPPIAVVCPGRVYRADAVDATHSPVFTQVEGLLVAEGITMAHLRGTLLAFARALFGDDREVRLRPSFFPFTEPSAEVDVSFESASGWLEILGSGMVDPAVLAGCGIDPERYSGFAFGIGVERVAMLRHGVADIRDLYDADARFLAAF
jgi:phenylalanyl-tRNA synthetase alpha chain